MKVLLDSLIPREDFEVQDNQTTGLGRNKQTVDVNDLKQDSFFLSAIRKPDFQRETNEWDVNKVCEFIESFLDGELIPAIILWRSAGSYIFVIDGSHRLSALIAWINDDYGDGPISRAFYKGSIPEEQKDIAEKTRRTVRRRIGLFSEYQAAIRNPQTVDEKVARRARNLAALSIQVQWVEGDSSTAESSFFKINQQGTPIDPTELRLLQSRRKPTGLAARAIIRSGQGHKYWSRFAPDKQEKIEELASQVHEILFSPELTTPIKSVDLPIGGKLYSAQTLPLIFEFIHIANGIQPNQTSDSLQEDKDGEVTISFLTNCKNLARRINSNHPSSLGLHPIVYFYSQTGRYKVASFFAIASLVKDLEATNSLVDFIKVRRSIESFLLNYDYLIQQIVRKYRDSIRSYPHIKKFLLSMMKEFRSTTKVNQAVSNVLQTSKFNYLTLSEVAATVEGTVGGDFSRETKSAVFIREAIKGIPMCAICGGYLHANSISIDHKKRKQDGGTNALDNAQLTHPYCNSTFKN